MNCVTPDCSNGHRVNAFWYYAEGNVVFVVQTVEGKTIASLGESVVDFVLPDSHLGMFETNDKSTLILQTPVN